MEVCEKDSHTAQRMAGCQPVEKVLDGRSRTVGRSSAASEKGKGHASTTTSHRFIR